MHTAESYLKPEVIRTVGRLDLRARFIVEGFLSGLHTSPFHGFSVEFSEHRKYASGDDPRTIDWSVFARTDRLYVKKYEAETNLACYLLVDTSKSMDYPEGHDLILFQVLDWSEVVFPFRDLSRFEDPETGQTLVAQPDVLRGRYVETLRAFIEHLRKEAAALRADFVQVDTSMSFDRALVRF